MDRDAISADIDVQMIEVGGQLGTKRGAAIVTRADPSATSPRRNFFCHRTTGWCRSGTSSGDF